MKKIVFLISIALITLACEKQDFVSPNLSEVKNSLPENGVKTEVTPSGDVQQVIILPDNTDEIITEIINQ